MYKIQKLYFIPTEVKSTLNAEIEYRKSAWKRYLSGTATTEDIEVLTDLGMIKTV